MTDEIMQQDQKKESKKVLVKGGKIYTKTGFLKKDVLLDAGKIEAVQDTIEALSSYQVFDAQNCVVVPGFVDLHTHLRQPGDEAAETIHTAAKAAALGGYTALTAMANTDPPTDDPSAVLYLTSLVKEVPIEIEIAAGITKGRRGEELSPMAELAGLGVKIFTDDGNGVQDGRLMRQALLYAKNLGVILAQHLEDDHYSSGGCVNEGEVSATLGLTGRSYLAEEIMLQRDIALVRETGARMHFMHVSSAKSLPLLQAAKAAGLAITAEVTPHHLSLCESLLYGFDPVYKVHPPLRTPEDVEALKRAFYTEAIDVLATDHAPHTSDRKEQPMDMASPGMLGLQTAFSVAYAASCLGRQPLGFLDLGSVTDWTDNTLQKSYYESLGELESASLKKLSLDRDDNAGNILNARFANLIQKMSVNPANILGMRYQGAEIAVGNAANMCVIDLMADWIFTQDAVASKSLNSPFFNIRLPGVIRHTFSQGTPVVADGEVLF
ncbi:MAG: dihydroorotase [Firmicutes bacterium]|nr:dihydroorotase [Bacillota bacterium]